jgi:Domain of unknown function (DUF4265)
VTEQLVKIRFEVDPKDWHGHGGEFLWASPADSARGEFEVLNSPFYARGVSFKDVVKASPSGDGRTFEFERVIRRSGHSTYRLLVEPGAPNFQTYWAMLEQRGCSYESGPIDMNIGRRDHYSIDVPPSADIHEIYRLLEKGERDGVWDFEEGHAHLPQK